MAKPRTRPSRIEYAWEASGAGWSLVAIDVVQQATKKPAIVAASERTMHSVSNCRESRARLAPSADRMESSVVRLAVRASKRFATLVHASSRMSATAAISINEAFFAVPASSSCNGVSVGGCFIFSIWKAGARRLNSAA